VPVMIALFLQSIFYFTGVLSQPFIGLFFGSLGAYFAFVLFSLIVKFRNEQNQNEPKNAQQSLTSDE
jgi:hypothetical protein